MKRQFFLTIGFVLALAGVSRAQLSGYNLLEYSFGNVPGEEPSDVHALYDQFNLQYKLNAFTASVRFENYYSSLEQRDEYSKITQFAVGYRKKGWDLKIGNLQETLGKGLLFRGYDIRNSVFENQIYRVKSGFYRDLQGAKAGFENKHFSIKLLHGKSLVSELPPSERDRRIDEVSAAEAGINIGNQRIGGIYMSNRNNTEKAEYLSAFAEGALFKKFSYYGEYAHGISGDQRFLNHNAEAAYGAYFNLNYASSGLGITLEVKDYQNFFIGSGISDPPTLVKEHSYRLLNRSTHVPFLFDESGLQLEVFFVPATNQLITINHSRNKNEIGESTLFKSAEYFAEWQVTTKNDNQMKVYADYSFDDLLAENARYATGVYYTYLLPDGYNLAFESEFQHLERTIIEKEKFQNVYAGIILSRSTKYSAGLIWEFTNDNKYADLSGTERVEKVQHYPGVNLSYRPNRKNTLQLFAGKRRGGPACTAGICYEVIDFKGVELRWTIRI